MKEILVNYTAYNVWANKLVVDVIRSFTDEQWHQDLGGSFPSVAKTSAHILLAESIWMQRLMMAEKVVLPPNSESLGMKDLCDLWLKASEKLLSFTQKVFDDRGFEHTFHYHNLAGELQKSKVWECLQHVCNHSTFHRGQLIHFFRMLGITKIPATDFIVYSRKKGSNS
jgi:uncharacterized damage-inducible protein DinB